MEYSSEVQLHINIFFGGGRCHRILSDYMEELFLWNIQAEKINKTDIEV